MGHFRVKLDQIFQTDQRSLISTVTQLRTGHGYFNSYLSRISPATSRTKGATTTAHPHRHRHISF